MTEASEDSHWRLQGLSSETIETYRRQGVVKIDLIDLIGQEAFDDMRQAFLDAEARDFAFMQEPGWHAPKTAVRRYPALRHHYPAIAAVAYSPAIGKAAAQLADVPRVRLWGDHTLIKVPGGSATAWHQDLPHFPIDRSGWVNFWIAIDDLDHDTGPLQYLPGSHRLGTFGRLGYFDNTRPLSHEALSNRTPPVAGFDHLIKEEDRQFVGQPLASALRAGEAFVHNGLVLHGSGENRTDRPRRVLGIIYFDADAQYTGMPRMETDGLGLRPFGKFYHPNFPLIG